MQSNNERIVLGGGCFWCVEAVFENVPGVISITPGYAGGTTDNPTYKEVCKGNTGHAEVVMVEFDTGQVTLEKILDIFFATHDPTSKDRQGNDVGTQYRSAVLFTEPNQEHRIREFIEKAASRYKRPIVTEVKPLQSLYPAEEYHRGYYRRNRYAPYCQVVIAPKVDKTKKKLNQT